MATGKALPYFIFIFFPNIVSLLPKPGKWFIYLKYFFALMLLFSVIWLGNIFFDTNKYRSEQKLDYWETFDIKLISEYLDKDEKIFVDVTAKWCLTCAINKKLVLDSKIIKDLFSNNNIKILRADWTDRNEDILQYLKTFNKYGIPFNVFYNKNYPDGYIFNEILTKKEVIKIIKKNE